MTKIERPNSQKRSTWAGWNGNVEEDKSDSIFKRLARRIGKSKLFAYSHLREENIDTSINKHFF